MPEQPTTRADIEAVVAAMEKARGDLLAKINAAPVHARSDHNSEVCWMCANLRGITYALSAARRVRDAVGPDAPAPTPRQPDQIDAAKLGAELRGLLAKARPGKGIISQPDYRVLTQWLDSHAEAIATALHASPSQPGGAASSGDVTR